MTTEAQQRQRVVDIAHSWERTPYHHAARVKGVGVDCLMLIAEIFEEAGLVPKIKIEHYPFDWMQHREAEKILNGLLEYSKEIEGEPQPGDIVLWKYGRCFSHAAVVINWPTVIHACVGTNVQQEDVLKSQALCYLNDGKPRPRKYFSYWAK